MRTRVVVGVVALLAVGAVIGGFLAFGGGDGDEGTDVTATGPRTLDLVGDTGDQSGAEPAIAPARPVEYVVEGSLPALPDRARVYRIVPTVDDAAIAALATAFGLEGQVQRDESGMRTVQDGDLALSVAEDGNWTYGSRDGTVSSGVAVAEPGCAGPDCPVSSDDPPPQRPQGLPTEAEAERVAVDVAKRAGVDIDSADVTVFDNIQTLSIQVAPRIAGLPVAGWEWRFDVGVGGTIVVAGGRLARTEVADEYPLIGTDAALQRLRDGNAFPIGPQPLAEGGDAVYAREPAPVVGAPEPAIEEEPQNVGGPEPSQTEPAAPPQADPAEPGQTEPGSTGSGVPGDPGTDDTVPTEPVPDPQPVEPERITITGARLGLAIAPTPDGGAYLVPVYLFATRAEDGTTGEVHVLALPDEFVETHA